MPPVARESPVSDADDLPVRRRFDLDDQVDATIIWAVELTSAEDHLTTVAKCADLTGREPEGDQDRIKDLGNQRNVSRFAYVTDYSCSPELSFAELPIADPTSTPTARTASGPQPWTSVRVDCWRGCTRLPRPTKAAPDVMSESSRARVYLVMGNNEMDDATAVAGILLERDTGSMSAPDRAAMLETLYEAHRVTVYRYLRTRTASDDEAGDLVATTFERAFVAIDRIRPEGSALPWLLRIARNAAIDRSRRQRPVHRLDDLREADQPISHTTPEDTFLEAERKAELRRLVFALPDAQRDAVALRYAAGLSAREIGQVIGKSEAATQKLIQRALVALREGRHVDF